MNPNIYHNCGSCNKFLRPSLRIINCSLCLKFFHVKCCNTTKKEFFYALENTNKWICKGCVVQPNCDANKTNCGACSKNIPLHLRTIACSNCNKYFHCKCTDTNRKLFKDIKDKGLDWNCNSCRTPVNNSKNVKCLACKKKISSNRTLIRCSECKKDYHAKCAGISIDVYNSLTSWSCDRCVDSTMPFSKIDNELLRLTLQAKDSYFGEHIQHAPSFSIQTLLDKFPGTLSCEDFSLDTVTSKYYTPSEFIGAKFKKGSFTMLHINIVSLSAHIDDLKILLDLLSHPFDIIGVSETKIRDTGEPITNISLPGYDIEYTPT